MMGVMSCALKAGPYSANFNRKLVDGIQLPGESRGDHVTACLQLRNTLRFKPNNLQRKHKRA
jgi:hypothetical protein